MSSIDFLYNLDRKGGLRVIQHKKLFIFGLVSVIICFLLSLSFPNGRPLAEIIVSDVGWSVYSNNDMQSGWNYVGIALFFIFLNGVSYMFYSMKKYQFRAVGLALIIGILGPSYVGMAYKSTFANGIHAITYEKQFSECTYEMDEATNKLHGQCWIPMQNHSNDHVSFNLEFLEHRMDDFKMDSLMNVEGPYTIKLYSNETKQIS